MRLALYAALGLCLTVGIPAALAQSATPPASAAPAAAPQIYRGTLVSQAGQSLTVKDAAGAVTTVTLTDDWRVFQIKRIEMSAIAPGSFIATTNVDQPDGSGVSTEFRVFAPALKGLGEGHYSMEDGTGNMMTNGTVSAEVKATPRGREMDVTYSGKGGTGVRHIVVPDDMVIRSVTPMERTDLKPGIAVEFRAAPGPDGKLTARRVLIGDNGQPPVD